jgi:hypothetical protein
VAEGLAVSMVRIEGYVWRDKLTEVHAEGLNLYRMGPESWCQTRDNRHVYYRERKGDQ